MRPTPEIYYTKFHRRKFPLSQRHIWIRLLLIFLGFIVGDTEFAAAPAPHDLHEMPHVCTDRKLDAIEEIRP